eukprot:gb/GFBE01035658.1/.p1 GENE.gb/GFBE01035658.1/~~gb/GFBE01035658.1/.p1  ORF type:complete len:196 (+),score=28.83 gb/GFBE01035658.1/:1-588(+)
MSATLVKRRRVQALPASPSGDPLTPHTGPQDETRPTPEKVPRLVLDPDQELKQETEAKKSLTLADVHEALPDFAGRLAECLWAEVAPKPEVQNLPVQRREVQVNFEPHVRHMLCTGRSAQLMFVVSIKEGRLRPGRANDLDYVYMHMCELLSKALPAQWDRSRTLTMSKTADADYKFALATCQLHRDSTIICDEP